MKYVLLINLLCLSVVAKEHRHHEAHEHGSAKMSLAFEGLKGRIEFKSAAESILGFEYVPKTAKDKETLQNTVKSITADFSKMVQLDSTLGCVFSADTVAQKTESKKSNHSNFIANFNIECTKSVVGTTIKFDFSKYSKLKDIDVTILADKIQKTLEISNQVSTVELK